MPWHGKNFTVASAKCESLVVQLLSLVMNVQGPKYIGLWCNVVSVSHFVLQELQLSTKDMKRTLFCMLLLTLLACVILPWGIPTLPTGLDVCFAMIFESKLKISGSTSLDSFQVTTFHFQYHVYVLDASDLAGMLRRLQSGSGCHAAWMAKEDSPSTPTGLGE